ncbi:SDR family oxidoreductase [Streptomyces sp. NBC_00102]|uniref:SDR family oxidoreductase n=1 Tax=Streptomyces sp. NBC_00102 TaxID=2975652 RepID=UPI00225A4359|nr:SDR family oxidoreductase [Streptomyces sp. NBC_00102]MCX5398213.1 SDR family oxidoreductase [Streptomyces sp. NBC_00102]
MHLPGARERWVRTGGIELCVAELGNPERPTVVLVHGYPDSKEVWSRVAPALAEEWHVVLYDVRGHGRSTAPKPLRGGFTLEKLTDDFLAVLDEVSPGRPVHLVGHDWGSVQSWEFATVERTKGRIASFTSMSGPSLDHFGHWIQSRLSRPTPRRVLQLTGQGAKSWYVYLLHTPVLPELAWRGPLGRRWPDILERLEKVPAGEYPTASLPRDAAHGAWLYRDNVRTRLRRPRPDAYAHVPVQLITPTGDAFLSESLYDGLERWVPSLVRRRLPAQHWVPRTRPDQLVAWISGFAAAQETSAAGPATTKDPSAAGAYADRFAGQLVLVTGAADGVGRATALAFAGAGARVVAVDRDAAGAARTAETARLVGATGAWAETAEPGDEQAVEKLGAKIAAEHGTVDVLVNLVGPAPSGSFLETTAEEWRSLLDTGLLGVVHGCRVFGGRMAERGQGGHIVNVLPSASGSPSAVPGIAAHGTAQTAVLALSQGLRAELAPRTVSVSAVIPGVVDAGTPPTDGSSGSGAGAAAKRPRGSTPERVAEAVLEAVARDMALVVVGGRRNGLLGLLRGGRAGA